jgi:hypothetical protein
VAIIRIYQHSPWPNQTEIFCDSQKCGQKNRYVVLITHSIYFSTNKEGILETKVGTFRARRAAACTQKRLPLIELDSQPPDLCGLHNRRTCTYLCLGAGNEKCLRKVIRVSGFSKLENFIQTGV